MRIGDFDLYRDLLKAKSGLSLTPDKSYLLDSRLSPVVKKWNYQSLEAMTLALRGVPEPKLVKDIVEAMMTGETSFFRDIRPFDVFAKVILPYLARERASKRSLRIWCAAASSGQEPYSLAMILKENAQMFPGWNIQILATDISSDALDIAKKGRYSQFEAQRGLPILLLIKYLEQAGGDWKIKDEIRKFVHFDTFNLMDDVAKLGAFDVIFCRNVLSYFDEATQKATLEKIAKRLPEDGFLFLGKTESPIGLTEAIKLHEKHKSLFVLKDGVYDLGEPSGQAVV